MSQKRSPRYLRATPEQLAELGEAAPEPRRKKARRKRRHVVEVEPIFDITRWRLPAKWRNDKRVGDASIGKMLHGVDLTRFEELSR